MIPVFIFIALPTLSLALLLAIIFRRLTTPALQVRAHQAAMRRAMSRLEALRLLGLDDAADQRAIRAAYMRLMVKYHPDRGGSHNVAARLNLARDTLLRAKTPRAA